MKIINLFGNEYNGSIGKSITASKWKGRNYLKKWFKPTNPNTAAQQVVRSLMSAGNGVWHDMASLEKGAYYWYQRYRKTNISPFNAMIGSYITQEKAAPDSYTGPPALPPGAKNIAGGAAIEGVKVLIRKQGQATDYYLEYTASDGNCPRGLTVEDQNYDLFLTHPQFEDLTLTGKTAVLACVQHEMTGV